MTERAGGRRTTPSPTKTRQEWLKARQCGRDERERGGGGVERRRERKGKREGGRDIERQGQPLKVTASQ